MRRALWAALLVAMLVPGTAAAAKIRLIKVGRFAHPVYVAAPPADKHRVFVVQQTGLVNEIKDGVVQPRPFLDIRSRVHHVSEEGLFSIAFAPDYATSHLFYAFFTGTDDKQHIEEFHATTPDQADAGSARVVLVEDDPDKFKNNGGQLQFGPDGDLYIGDGDGGGGEQFRDPFHTAQDLDSLLGKILRIDPRATADGAPYGIPAGNPFLGTGQRPEIYMYGVRNPWRFSFDAQTGDLVVADVGREAYEEVDYFKRGQGLGADLGWPAYEGTDHAEPDVSAPDPVAPVMEYNHQSDHFCAITGGYVSRDPADPAIFGKYLFSDLCRGGIFVSKLRQPTTTSVSAGVKITAPVSFGQDARKRLYVVALGGSVYRIAAAKR